MNLLNKAVYGAAFRRYGKSLRVLPVLEKGEVRARALRSWDRGTSGRWHIHCAIELPSHFDGIALENLIRDSWAKVEWGYGRILVRDGANAGWINYRDVQTNIVLHGVLLRVLGSEGDRGASVIRNHPIYNYAVNVSLRRTKATLIYRRTGNLRAVQLLLGHTKIESTVRYLGIEVDDALSIAEQVDL
jgi:hypothetical protein